MWRFAKRCLLALTACLLLTSIWSPRLAGTPQPTGPAADVVASVSSTEQTRHDANRLTYLDDFLELYHVHRDFPKLTTPQWVGQEGVEAVVVLGIDDMTDSQRYEDYLRPILERLKQIDGRAPVSIMTNQIDPQDPRLQQWLAEGLSIDTHTWDHPCPCLADSHFGQARDTFQRCVDVMASIPGNRPVAFRMPCCDSMNSPSPRFYAEIFHRVTPGGNFLTIDTSVFHLFTPADPSLPREAVYRPDGGQRFRHYVPFPSFVNLIENYPYPYLVGRGCWQFPCMVPSDWEGQHVQAPNNPETVRDLQIALDLTVQKQGVLNLVFHPHGWIRNDQIIQLIDHAVTQHGDKVKFLTFREADDRLRDFLLGGQPLRAANGGDNGVRLLDLTGNGFMDVVIGNHQVQETRIWRPEQRSWESFDFPVVLIPPNGSPEGSASGSVPKADSSQDSAATEGQSRDEGPATAADGPAPAARWGLTPQGQVLMLATTEQLRGAWLWTERGWRADPQWLEGLEVDGQPVQIHSDGRDRGVRLRDLNGDGRCELIVSNPDQQQVFQWTGQAWRAAAFQLPEDVRLVDEFGRDAGLRFVDIDEDGIDDILFSDAHRYSLHLGRFDSHWEFLGWPVIAQQAEVIAGQERGIPAIVRDVPPGGPLNNGVWFANRHLWVQNEDTSGLPDRVDRRTFDQLLGDQAALPAARSPQRSLQALQPRPGMQVELVASEPLLVDPVAFDWGPDGRLWVVEMRDYPSGMDGRGKPGGRVRVLSDTTGDGRYDHSQIFLEDLNFPTGVKVWRQGILVTAAPEIFYAEDTTGDGRADHRETLYRGFTEGNQQHLVNGLRWGLDNWLHVANGDSGGTVQSVQTGETVGIGGRDLRIHPDSGAVVVESGMTQFGRDRDDWDHWFGGNNSFPIWHYVLSDADLRRNPHWVPGNVRRQVSIVPGAAPVFPISRTLPRFNDFHMAERFTSACSPTIYRDRLLGPQYYGNFFVCEPVHNLVQREVMEPEGVTFTSRRAADEQDREFLASTDHWFRPTMVRTGPDGALWVADMYRLVIEHPEWIPNQWQARLDLRAGAEMGRLYRIFPEDVPPRPFPRLDGMTPPQWVQQLTSDNGWVRDMAQQLLVWEQPAGVVPPLEELLAGSPNPLARVHALATLDGLGELSNQHLIRGLQDPHPGVRRLAVKLAGPRLDEGSRLRQVAVELVQQETEAMVVLQVALAIGETRHPEFVVPATGLVVGHLQDPYIQMALISSLHDDSVVPILERLLADWPTAGETDQEGVSGRTGDRQDVERGFDEVLAAVLRFALATGNLDPVATLVQSLVPDGSEIHGEAEGESNHLVQSLARRLADPQRAQEVAIWRLNVLAELLESIPASLRNDLPEPLARPLRRTTDLALEALHDTQAGVNQQTAATRLLAQVFWAPEEALRELRTLLNPRTPPPVQLAAVRGMAGFPQEVVADYLLENWRSHSPSMRAEILDVIFSRSPWTLRLLEAVAEQQIPPAHLDAVRRRQLLSHPNETIRQQAESVLVGSLDSDRQQLIENYMDVGNLSGDVDRGRGVFRQHCAACHRMEDFGHDVGPDLAAFVDKSDVGLLTAILDPNRAIEDRYQEYLVLGQDGRQHRGMIANETSNAITLMGQEGKQVSLLRSEIDELSATGQSLMPEGLEKEIPVPAMADLIAYLRSSVPPAKSFPGNQPALPHVRDDGSIRLLATNCRIYGPSLVFEQQYRNLGFWGDAQDRAVWTIQAPRAGRYGVTLDYACADGTAGNRFVIQVAGQSIGGVVAGTGTWDDYHWQDVGFVELVEGQQELILRSDGPIEGYLMDLRSIILWPVQ